MPSAPGAASVRVWQVMLPILSPTAASLENGVRNRAWLCGPARDIVAYLKQLEARYPGLEHVMIAWTLSTRADAGAADPIRAR